MMVKVSVIVPIYNVEKYIKQCIDSLLNQTLKEIEIVLVDDGTLDRAGEIAEEYKSRFHNIKVIHQENGGLGPARNTGIENAIGEYIAFVDGDDWVQEDMYEKLYKLAKINDSDIVVSGHCDYKNGIPVVIKKHPLSGKTFKSREEINVIRKKLFGHCPDDKDVEAFPMSVCMSLYRRDIINKFNLRFKKILSEDTIFNIAAYSCANTISFTTDTGYCYRKDEQDSITKTLNSNKHKQFVEFLIELKNLAIEENDFECKIRAKRMAIDYCRLYVGIVSDSNLNIKEKKRYIREFVEDKEIYECWAEYPVSTLPLQQRVFHLFIEHKLYSASLLLVKIREILKVSLIHRLKIINAKMFH